jgi:uncharacterized membrane protein YgaE (UPF0421/DUF939 family)
MCPWGKKINICNKPTIGCNKILEKVYLYLQHLKYIHVAKSNNVCNESHGYRKMLQNCIIICNKKRQHIQHACLTQTTSQKYVCNIKETLLQHKPRNHCSIYLCLHNTKQYTRIQTLCNVRNFHKALTSIITEFVVPNLANDKSGSWEPCSSRFRGT